MYQNITTVINKYMSRNNSARESRKKNQGTKRMKEIIRNVIIVKLPIMKKCIPTRRKMPKMNMKTISHTM